MPLIADLEYWPAADESSFVDGWRQSLSRELIVAHTGESTGRVVNALCRAWFRFSTLSGIRSLVNRAHSRRVARAHPDRSRLTDRAILPSSRGDLLVHVHLRRCPLGIHHDRTYGLVSARFTSSPIPSLLYRYLCLTSHFGVGHLEAAFYVEGDRCVVYAVRNIARAHALRLGMSGAAERLALTRRAEDVAIFELLAPYLAERFAELAVASPEESIALAVDQRLLHPTTRTRFLETLHRRTHRLSQRVALSVAPAG